MREHEDTIAIGAEIQEAVRTSQAVTQQLAGMGAQHFELGVRSSATGTLIPFVDTPETIQRRLSWLKYKNVSGSDVYIRPAGSVGLVLVDDLTQAQLTRMEENGHQPSVITQTSPENYQAWVRVSEAPIAPAIASAAAKLLATEYDADSNSAAWRHYGRLAGFTNRKEKYQRADGTFPYVLLLRARPCVAPQGAELLTLATATLATAEQAVTRHTFYAPTGEGVSEDLTEEYRREIIARQLLYRGKLDYSRLDYGIVKTLAISHPTATPVELMAAMREASPHIEERKKGHIDDYIQRTVHKALHDPDVVRSRRAPTH